MIGIMFGRSSAPPKWTVTEPSSIGVAVMLLTQHSRRDAGPVLLVQAEAESGRVEEEQGGESGTETGQPH